MDSKGLPLLKAFSVGVPLLLLGDGLTKGRFRLQGPIRMSAGGYVRRSEQPLAFWSVAALLLLASAAIAWFVYSYLAE